MKMIKDTRVWRIQNQILRHVCIAAWYSAMPIGMIVCYLYILHTKQHQSSKHFMLLHKQPAREAAISPPIVLFFRQSQNCPLTFLPSEHQVAQRLFTPRPQPRAEPGVFLTDAASRSPRRSAPRTGHRRHWWQLKFVFFKIQRVEKKKKMEIWSASASENTNCSHTQAHPLTDSLIPSSGLHIPTKP